MKLHALRLTNFRQHSDTEIQFQSGITGIIGPNGAGKTTILEAIAFALYSWGRTSRDQMTSFNAPPRSSMRVELEFELGAHRYRVIRGRNVAELYLDGEFNPIADSAAAVNERLHRLLGMSREEFFRTYFTGQKELAAMAVMAPAERARFLSKVLGYERLRIAQDLVIAHRKMLSSEINGLRAAMPDREAVENAIAEAGAREENAALAVQTAEHRQRIAKSNLEVISPRWDRVQNQREKAQQLLAQIALKEAEEAAAQKNLTRVNAELEAIARARAELERLEPQLEPLDELSVELNALDALYREEGKRQTLIESETALSQELERLGARLTALEQAPQFEQEVSTKLQQIRAELEQTQTQLETRKTDWVRDRQEAETKLKELRREHADVTEQRDRVLKLGKTGKCPTCSRELGESVHEVVEHLSETAGTLLATMTYYDQRVEQLHTMPADIAQLTTRRTALANEATALERKYAKVQAALAELASLRETVDSKEKRREQLRREIASVPRGYDAGRHRYVSSEIERLRPLAVQRQRLTIRLESEAELVAQRSQFADAIETLVGAVGTLRTRQEQAESAALDHDRLRSEHERCVSESREAELELRSAQIELRNAQTARATAVAAGERARATEQLISERERDRALHEELDRAFNEMRSQLNAELRPELSELGTAFMRELMDSRTAEFELDDRYNIVVLEDGVAKPVLSGGEEDLANLVLRLAVSQMIAERSGQQFSLLVLDEVFGSLDEKRRYNVLELLRALGDRFEQVILITHIEGVRDGLDQVLAVRFDPSSGSSVVASTPPMDVSLDEPLDLMAAGVH